MMAIHDRFRARPLALILVATATLALGGCGGGESATGATKVDPQSGRRHREMEDYMKNSPAKASSSKSARNHP